LNEPNIYDGDTVSKFVAIVFFLKSLIRFGVEESSLDLIVIPIALDLFDFISPL
jgi:hypothetical protein